ncbi:ABC transporter substrate-binding protein [Dactylosporangium sp. CA-092794]|uniref:ABC transporter substrate-binding protein n=1 Tax=Dactylosporangium sp. CA-092794 TaxID=3239929 RepID=UPI003D91B313
MATNTTIDSAPRRHRRGRVAGAIAFATATALLATGCSSGDDAAASGGGTYNVGASLILSGPAAAYGANTAGGMQAYFQYINDQGGVNGKKIQLDMADGGLTAAPTIQSLKQLVQQNHSIVIGGMLASSGNSGAGPTINSLKVTTLLGSPGSDLNRPPINQYVYGAGAALYGDEAYMEAEFAKANIIKKANPKIAIIYEISSETQVWADNMKKIASDNSWNIVDTEAYQVGTTDFSAQAAKIASAQPDYIIAVFDASNFAFIKALMAANVSVPIVSNQGGPHADQMQQLNYPALYVGRELVFPIGDDPAVTQYLDLVKKYGGKADPQSHITQYGYLQAKIIVQVLKQCGANCDAASFNKTIASLKTIDTGGFSFAPITYSSANTVGINTARFYTWDAAARKVVLLPGTYTHDA